MKPKLLLLIFIIFFTTTKIFSQTLNRNFPITNGTVTSVIEKDSIAYLGGYFSLVGNPTLNLAKFTNGKQDVSFPWLNGFINDFESDGSGGYYIVGSLKSYHDTAINTEVLHINNDFSIDKNFKDVHTDQPGSIACIKRKDNYIYIGGSFTQVDSISSGYLGILNIDGTVSTRPFDKPSSPIYQIQASDSLLIIKVDNAGGITRYIGDNYYLTGIAGINLSTGKLEKKFLVPDGSITGIDIDSNKLYAAGSFQSLGYNTSNLAKIAVNDSISNPNFPSVNGIINAVVADNNGGYFVAGNFTYIGNKPRANIAHILKNGDIDDQFNLNFGGVIFCLAIDSNYLYIGGDFGSYRSAGSGFAAINLQTYNSSSLNVKLNSYVNTITCSKNAVFIGGNFTQVNGIKRTYVAAIDKNGALLKWNPSANAAVSQLLLNPSETFVYMKGTFSRVNSVARDEVAKVDVDSGIATSWKPNFFGEVYSLQLFNNLVYVGGSFKQINSIARISFGAVDTLDGNVSDFKADLGTQESVSLLYNGGDKLYIAGEFSSIAGLPKSYLVRLDSATSTIDNWNPQPAYAGMNPINSICEKNGDIIIGGYFKFFKKANANLISVIDLKTASPTSFTFPGNVTYDGRSAPSAVLHYNSQIFLGGNFSYVFSNNTSATSLCSVDDESGFLKHNFLPSTNWGIKKLTINDSLLVVSGDSLSVYNLKGDTTITNLYAANGPIAGAEFDSAKDLLIGGNFTMINPKPRQGLAAVNINNNRITEWDPKLAIAPTGNQPYINCMSQKDSMLYIGGYFQQVNSQTRNYIAAISFKTGLPNKWRPSLNGAVNGMSFDSGATIYVSGGFTQVNQSNRNYLAAIKTSDTGSVTTWKPDLTLNAENLMVVKNSVYLIGYFSMVNNTPRNYIARVDKKTGQLDSWNPNPAGPVYSLAYDSSTIFLGGGFNNISGQARNSLASFNLNTDTLNSFDINISSSNGLPQAYSLSLKNKFLYFGFYDIASHTINDSIRTALPILNLQTNTVTSFNPFTNQSNYSQYVTAQKINLYSSGYFNYQDQTLPSLNFACFTLPPDNSSKSLVIKYISSDTATASWVKGNGQGRLLIVKEGKAPSVPKDGKSYFSNSIFGDGEDVGDSSFVIYNDNGSKAIVSGLKSNHTYYFSLVDYNGNGTSTDYLQESLLTKQIFIPCSNNPAIVNAPDSTTNLCPATVITLSSPTAVSYLWNTKDTTQNITVNSSGKFKVITTDLNGCRDTSNTILVNYQNCTPPSNLSALKITSSGVKLKWDSMSCALSYKVQYRKKGAVQWISSNIETTNKILNNLAASTTYEWRVATKCRISPLVESSYSNGNEFTTTASSSNLQEQDIVLNDNKLNVTVSPNPTLNNASLFLSGNQKNIDILLTDVNGKTLSRLHVINQSIVKLSTQNLASGVYLIKVNNGKEEKTLKLVKE